MIIYNALYWGRGVKKNYSLQVRNIVQGARQKLGEVPILIGECGVPMDLKSVTTRWSLTADEGSNEEAFQTGNFTWHERMMDSVICAFETNMVGFKCVNHGYGISLRLPTHSLWTYNPLSRDDIGDDVSVSLAEIPCSRYQVERRAFLVVLESKSRCCPDLVDFFRD